MSNWISVKDRLPEKDGDYLCYDSREIKVYCFYKDLSDSSHQLYWTDAGEPDYKKEDHNHPGFVDFSEDEMFWGHYEVIPDYWMPLPEPPTDI